MEYGIISDLVAVRSGVPHIKLQQAYVTEDSRFAYYYDNAMRRLPGRSLDLAVTPDGNTVIRYHYHTTVDGTDYLFAFTKAHAYLWSSGTTTWGLMFTCSSDCTYWSTASFNGKVIATNNIDKVLEWLDSTPGTAFAVKGAASGIAIGGGEYVTKAKFVVVYRDYLHLLYTEEAGTSYPSRDRWSSNGDDTDFDETGLGDTGARDFSPGLFIMGAGFYTAGGNNLLVVFTNKTVETEWLVTGDLVFEWNTALHDLGCSAPDSVVNDKDGNLYWLGTDSAFHRFLDTARLSSTIDSTVRQLHPTLLYYARGVYIQKYNRLWWSVPSMGNSTGNDLVLSYNLESGAWDPYLDMDISSFGQYREQTTYTIDTIPFATIDGISWASIDSVENVTGWSIDICSDYDGYSYRTANDLLTDKGTVYDSEIVIGTDLTNSAALNVYKRTEGAWVWFKRHPLTDYEAEILIKSEFDDDFISVATVDLSGTAGQIVRKWCPFDVRSRDFQIKVSAQNDFAFYGSIISFSLDGPF